MRPRAAPFLALCALVAACSSTGGSGASTSPAAASPTVAPTPSATVAGEYPALVAFLGEDAAPIDVAVAFGSVWVANHHSDDVVRIDPATGLEQARIPFTDGTGPGWFAVADDAVWVTRQNALGVARIDATTNDLDPNQAGALSPCWKPTIGLGAVWFWVCDNGQMVRIDLATFEATTVESGELTTPLAVDDVLYAAGPDGVMRLADDRETWTPVGGCCGTILGYAGGTLWLANDDDLVRVDPSTGAVVATIPITKAQAMSAGDDVAWFALAEGSTAVLRRVRVADNVVLGLAASSSEIVASHTGSSPGLVALSNDPSGVTEDITSPTTADPAGLLLYWLLAAVPLVAALLLLGRWLDGRMGQADLGDVDDVVDPWESDLEGES